MRSRPTREELLDVLKKFTAGELAIELFVNEFDQLGKLGVSDMLRDRAKELFGEFWRNYVDTYTPHYKKPTTVGSRLKRLDNFVRIMEQTREPVIVIPKSK